MHNSFYRIQHFRRFIKDFRRYRSSISSALYVHHTQSINYSKIHGQWIDILYNGLQPPFRQTDCRQDDHHITTFLLYVHNTAYYNPRVNKQCCPKIPHKGSHRWINKMLTKPVVKPRCGNKVNSVAAGMYF